MIKPLTTKVGDHKSLETTCLNKHLIITSHTRLHWTDEIKTQANFQRGSCFREHFSLNSSNSLLAFPLPLVGAVPLIQSQEGGKKCLLPPLLSLAPFCFPSVLCVKKVDRLKGTTLYSNWPGPLLLVSNESWDKNGF